MNKHLILNLVINKVIDNLLNNYYFFKKPGRNLTHLVSSIPRTAKTFVGWVFNFQISITYWDYSNFIYLGYQS